MRPKFKSIGQKCVFCFFLILCLYSCKSCKYREITVGIVGDQFGSYDTEKSYQIMQLAVQKLISHDPDVLLHVGDIAESIRGVDSFEDYEANFKTATTIMNGSGKPWLVAVGDHDVVPPRYQACSSDRSREKWFMDCCQRYETPVGEKPYYS
ncbi:MAG: metallophosphoesterase [Candidatus Marinimicrobia bacterium]|nr:metallophosphoesterase [Candidatus Neomarinimicrobiota bacterium]